MDFFNATQLIKINLCYVFFNQGCNLQLQFHKSMNLHIILEFIDLLIKNDEKKDTVLSLICLFCLKIKL